LERHDDHLILNTAKIKDALVQINGLKFGNPLVLFVKDDNDKIVGSITDGDLRRGFLKGITINNSVTDLMNKDFHYIKNLDNYEKIKKMKELDLKIIPNVTEDKKLIDFIDLTKIKAILPMDVVIMAGGQGIRLKP